MSCHHWQTPFQSDGNPLDQLKCPQSCTGGEGGSQGLPGLGSIRAQSCLSGPLLPATGLGRSLLSPDYDLPASALWATPTPCPGAQQTSARSRPEHPIGLFLFPLGSGTPKVLYQDFLCNRPCHHQRPRERGPEQRPLRRGPLVRGPPILTIVSPGSTASQGSSLVLRQSPGL